MEADFSWIYLIFFLMIPLARIIPRVLAKMRNKNSSTQTIQEEQFGPNINKHYEEPQSEFSKPEREFPNTQREFSKPQTKNMLVLGELHRGSKTFESIQRNTGLNNKELDAILEDLEKKDMLKVQHKQGLLGTKIELHPTEKGFKEYYS